MYFFLSHSNDPYFNLALEEYFLKSFSDDFFILYQNTDSIIVGKHQNALAEINQDFIKQHQIPVVRRLSGGGTVFHDMGNINYTYISNGKDERLVDFKRYSFPIFSALKKLGLDVEYSTRNDLFLKGKKISGNAEHIWKNRVLHHGTLLFSAQLDFLRGALHFSTENYKDNAVKSHKSEVCNISEALPNCTINQLIAEIRNTLFELFPEIELYNFNQEDSIKVNQLIETRYGKWDWNFGYSPKYEFTKSIMLKGESIEITLKVINGFIEEIKSQQDNTLLDNLKNEIIGLKHDKKGLLDANIDWEAMGFEKYSLIESLF